MLKNLSDLTIDGNGTTLHQTSYGDNTCSTDDHQPVIQLKSDTNLNFNDLTIEGPNECGGAGTEGDVGIYLGQSTPGNTGITFNGVTVEYTGGDGIDVYPQLGTCCGINTNITFENGTMTDIGYHAWVPEGVSGLTIANNVFTDVGNFMDLEIDNNYGPPYNTCDDTYADGLTGNAQCNITVEDNHFVSSNLALTSVSNGQCIPMGNVKVIGNMMDVNSSFNAALMGSNSTSADDCPQDHNLQIENNIQAVCTPSGYTGCGGGGGCGGSYASPGSFCAIVQIATWKNVTISGNQFLASAGNPGYFPNTPSVPCISVDQSANVAIDDNGCNNAWNVWDPYHIQFPPNSSFSNTNITDCGNVYWLT